MTDDIKRTDAITGTDDLTDADMMDIIGDGSNYDEDDTEMANIARQLEAAASGRPIIPILTSVDAAIAADNAAHAAVNDTPADTTPAQPTNTTPAPPAPAAPKGSDPKADINDFFDDVIELRWEQWVYSYGHIRLADLSKKHIVRKIKKDLLGDVQLTLELENAARAKDCKIPIPKTISAYAAANLILRTGDIAVTESGDDKVRTLMYYSHTGRDAGIWRNVDIDNNIIINIAAKLGVDDKSINATIRRVISGAPVIKEDDYEDIAVVDNGVLDMETYELTPYLLDNGRENPEYIVKYGNRHFFRKDRTAWNPAATDTILTGPDGYEWSVEMHFRQIFGDNQAAIDAIWQLYNFAIRGISGGRMVFLVDSTEQAAGGGAKSTTLNMVAEVIGTDNVYFSDLSDTTKRFGLSGLIGKQMVIGYENDSHTPIENVSILKKISRNEPVDIEKKGKDRTSYNFKGMVANAMQRPPKTKEKSSAFYRTILIIPFPAMLTKNADRKYIQNDFIKRREVREYIMKKALMLGNATEYKRETIDAMKQYTREARMSTSPVYKFMEEISETLQNPAVPFDAIYAAYRRFCDIRGYANPGNEDTFIADLTAWAVDNGCWRYVTAKRGETPKTLSRKSAPEPFLAEYGTPEWRENPDLKKSSLAEGGRWNPDKLGKKYRRWIERIEPDTGLADTQIRTTEKSPLEKEADYRAFCGAWCYANIDRIADGRATLDDIPDYEAWEKLGCPAPRYNVTAKRYAKTGFSINGWQSYGLQRDYPLGGLDPNDPVYCSTEVTA